MRTRGKVFVVTSLLCACTPASKSDAGLGTETFRFRVVQGDGADPLANVAVRVSGPNSFVDGHSDDDGQVEVVLANQRPLERTLARVDHGVLSIIGITDEFPTQVRMDAMAAHPPTEPISGTIAGKPDGARVVIDSFDFYTTSSDTNSYQSQYVSSSGYALPVVAFELSDNDEISNWTVTEGGQRVGVKVVNLSFPATLAQPSKVPWSAVLPPGGLSLGSPSVAGWQVMNTPTEAWISTGSGSATRDGTGLHGNFTSVSGPLTSNRLILEFVNGPYLMRHRQRELTGPIAFSLPQVDALAISGTSLGTLAATAAAPASGFDTFCLTVEARDVVTGVWRVCTAPGAPFSIPRLPDLPEGVSPSELSIATSATRLDGWAQLIDFEDPSMRPWLLQNSIGPLDAYKDTFSGDYQTITGAWR